MFPSIKPKPLVLLLLPLVEIVLFMCVVEWLGMFNALLLSLLQFLSGVVVLKQAGTGSIHRLTMHVHMSEGLSRDMLDAAMVFAAGVMLLVPGFLTGIIGLAMLSPWPRKGMARRVAKLTVSMPYGHNGVALDGEYNYVADNDEKKT